MPNPWNAIDLEDYETHMRAENVFQLQTLKRIMGEQFAPGYETIVILGAAGGNGLEHIDPATRRVYALDINESYLRACRERYGTLGDTLVTQACDLSRADTLLPRCDLLIANLIIEYLGIDVFCALLERNYGRFRRLSCVIQQNRGHTFVSPSAAALRLMSLEALHQNIEPQPLREALCALALHYDRQMLYELPNAKAFMRLDFSMPA